MSKIDCGEDEAVPCRCDPVTGCGHMSFWHVVSERWVAKCLVPGCDCNHMDVCNCVGGHEVKTGDASVLAEMGIKWS